MLSIPDKPVSQPPQVLKDMDERTVFVGNLGYRTTEETLIQEFSEFGRVLSARVARSADGASKGVAFIEFENRSDAEHAIYKLDRQIVDGREVFLKLASDPRTPDDVIQKNKQEKAKNKPKNFGNRQRPQRNSNYNKDYDNRRYDSRRNNDRMYDDRRYSDDRRYRDDRRYDDRGYSSDRRGHPPPHPMSSPYGQQMMSNYQMDNGYYDQRSMGNQPYYESGYYYSDAPQQADPYGQYNYQQYYNQPYGQNPYSYNGPNSREPDPPAGPEIIKIDPLKPAAPTNYNSTLHAKPR